MLNNARRLFLDSETTGMEVAAGHRVIELGLVETDMHNRSTGRIFHSYFNPDRSVDPDAQTVHGLSAQFLADKPRFADRLDEVCAYLEGAEIVIHNAGFDVAFLDAEFAKAGLGRKVSDMAAKVVDTIPIARTQFPGARVSLDALAKRFGLVNLRKDRHGALLDAELLRDVYAALSIRQEAMDLAAPTAAGRPALNLAALPPATLVRVSSDERARHEALMRQIEKKAGRQIAWPSQPPALTM